MRTAVISRFWEMMMALTGSGCRSLIAFACVTVASFASADSEREDWQNSVGPVLYQPSMNVFRRFSVDSNDMFEFYGQVLGIPQLETIGVGNGGVARFQAGKSELKFTRRVGDRSYVAGGVEDATGLRLISLYYPDRSELEKRFASHGLPAPLFRHGRKAGEAVAHVTDPDGQWVELIVIPNADLSVYEQVDVSLTVSDIEQSRAFYRDFAGLEEESPWYDSMFETMRYPYRHGSTTINLMSFGTELPADTGSGGIQYVVSNADRVEELAAQHGITVDQPLRQISGFTVRTIWLDDADGITNYFAETEAARQSR